MLRLHELQQSMVKAILYGDSAAVGAAIIDDGLSAEARLGIYRNHFALTLSDALSSTFPAVRWLVGEAFFRAAARRFARECPPKGPCLFDYGCAFPGWLGALPETRSIPWVHDVAQLEWALNRAQHVEDTAPLCAAELAAIGDDAVPNARLDLHPSVSLLASTHPIDQLWRANQLGCIDDVDLGCGGVYLVVHRRGDDVGWLSLPPAEFAFVSALNDGLDLAAAAAAAGGTLALSDLLVTLLDGGLLAGFRLACKEDHTA